MPRSVSSAVVIARHLGAEGFTPYVANRVESYWKNRSGLNTRQRKQIKKLEADISVMCKDMTAAQRLALGRFIGLHKKMAFDTGLTIGIQAFVSRNAGEVDIEEVNSLDVPEETPATPAA